MAMSGRRKSITFIGDKSSTTVSDVPTFHLSVPTPQSLSAPVIIVDVIEAVKKNPKQKREKHLHGKILGKEITDSVRVTEVLPGLARCPEKELAQVQIIHKSLDGDCLLYAVLNPLIGFPMTIQRLVIDTVKVRTGGAKRYDWFNITPVLRHVGITVLKTTKLNVTDDRLMELIALREGQFVVTYQGHAVGVDCSRRLIYDCAFDYAVDLSPEGFVRCDIHVGQKIRQIEINYSRLCTMIEVAENEKDLTALQFDLLERFCSASLAEQSTVT